MLVIGRRKGERILIGDDIVVTITDRRGGHVRVGIETPRGVPVMREEMLTRDQSDAIVARARAGHSGRKGATT